MSVKQFSKELGIAAIQTAQDGVAGVLGEMLNTNVPPQRPLEASKDFDEELKKLSNVTGKDYELAGDEIEGRYLGKVELAGKTYGMVQQHEKNVVGLVPWSEDLTGFVNKEVKISGRESRSVEIIQGRECAISRGLGE